MRGPAHLDMMSRPLSALTAGIFLSEGPPSVSRAWLAIDEVLHGVISTLAMSSPHLGDACLNVGDGARFTGHTATLLDDHGVAPGPDADQLYVEFRDWLKVRCGGSFSLRADRRYSGIRVDGSGVISVIPGRSAYLIIETDNPCRDAACTIEMD